MEGCITRGDERRGHARVQQERGGSRCGADKMRSGQDAERTREDMDNNLSVAGLTVRIGIPCAFFESPLLRVKAID